MVCPVKVLDSAFLVSLFLSHDDNHKKAKEMFDALTGDSFILPNLVLFETVGVINIKYSLAYSKTVYEGLSKNQQISAYNFSEAEYNEILDWYFEHGISLSVPDSAVIYLALKHKSEVLTFDKGLLKALEKAKNGE